MPDNINIKNMNHNERLTYLISNILCITKKEFARKIGIDLNVIYRWTNTQNNFDYFHGSIKMIKAFNININWLYSGIGHPILDDKNNFNIIGECDIANLSKMFTKFNLLSYNLDEMKSDYIFGYATKGVEDFEQHIIVLSTHQKSYKLSYYLYKDVNGFYIFSKLAPVDDDVMFDVLNNIVVDMDNIIGEKRMSISYDIYRVFYSVNKIGK